MKAALIGSVAGLGLIAWGWWFLVGVFIVALAATVVATILGADFDD